MGDDVKNSIKIEFTDYNGDNHIFYSERTTKVQNQVEFVGTSVVNFLKSLGWTDSTIEDVIEFMNVRLK